jgi:hypothetical protein
MLLPRSTIGPDLGKSLTDSSLILIAIIGYDCFLGSQGLIIDVAIRPSVPYLISHRVMVVYQYGRTCLFDIIHSALWGSKYPVCTPDAQVLFLSGARTLHMLHSTVQALTGRVQTAKAPFLLPAPSSTVVSKKVER